MEAGSDEALKAFGLFGFNLLCPSVFPGRLSPPRWGHLGAVFPIHLWKGKDMG